MELQKYPILMRNDLLHYLEWALGKEYQSAALNVTYGSESDIVEVRGVDIRLVARVFSAQKISVSIRERGDRLEIITSL